jgi:type I restriction enzyme M protein
MQFGRPGSDHTRPLVPPDMFPLLSQYKGYVSAPCSGSGGMSLQIEKFGEADAGKLGKASIYGLEVN